MRRYRIIYIDFNDCWRVAEQESSSIQNLVREGWIELLPGVKCVISIEMIPSPVY
jgi:hypothetical protein